MAAGVPDTVAVPAPASSLKLRPLGNCPTSFRATPAVVVMSTVPARPASNSARAVFDLKLAPEKAMGGPLLGEARIVSVWVADPAALVAVMVTVSLAVVVVAP